MISFGRYNKDKLNKLIIDLGYTRFIDDELNKIVAYKRVEYESNSNMSFIHVIKILGNYNNGFINSYHKCITNSDIELLNDKDVEAVPIKLFESNLFIELARRYNE